MKITLNLQSPSHLDAAIEMVKQFIKDKPTQGNTADRWAMTHFRTGIVGYVGLTRAGNYSIQTSKDQSER